MIGVALATFVVAVAALDARATYQARLTSDEPQYLLTAISLAEDGDLDISDELRQRRFLPFHEVALDLQTIELNSSGRRVSPHDPLLPLLLAPAMALGGWIAAKVMLAMVAAAAASLSVWIAVRRLGVSTTTSALVIGGFFCTPPLTSYATQVYPEIVAALLVLAASASLLGQPTTARGRSRHQLLVLAMVVALPWLAIKYTPISAVLGAGLLWPLRNSDRRPVLVLGSALIVAGAAYLIIHQRVYGGWTVYASGDHFVDGEFLVVGTDPDYWGRTRRLIGLLVDRGFGLVPWSLSYVFLLPALADQVRSRAPSGRLIVALVAAGWATATWVALTMHGWWWPGRQVVVLLPLVAIATAQLVDGRRRLLAATVTGSFLGTAGWLWLVFEASTDRRTLIVDFQDTDWPLYRLLSPLFPDQVGYGATDVARTVLWLVVLALLAVALARNRTADASPSTRRRNHSH